MLAYSEGLKNFLERSKPQQVLGLARLCRSFEFTSLEKAYG